MTHSRPELRRLIHSVLLVDSDFDSFCIDYFPEVARKLSAGMNRDQKINSLFEVVSETQQIASALCAFDPTKAHLFKPRALSSDNPYLGVAAFQVDQAHLFFGRGELTDKLWMRLKALYDTPGATRLLAVYGPSGSGKSSVARAGLLAELGNRPMTGPKVVRRVDMRPGEHPLRELALKLLPLVTQQRAEPDLGALRKLIDDLSQPSKQKEFDGLTLWMSHLADADERPLVLLIDQFEEIYSPRVDSAERDAFVALLLHAAGDGARRVSVVLALRSDFLGETHRYHPDLSWLVSEHGVLVPPMSHGELRDAIARPAEQAGLPIDDPTIDRLLTEARRNAEALPLLEFALAQIWDGMKAGESAGKVLVSIRGIGGALSGKAQEIYGALSESEQATARRAFTRLVQFGDGTKDTRRRAPIAELCGRNQIPDDVHSVLLQFASEHARLVTLSGDSSTRTAEVTHEAIFEHWTDLRTWIDESRADRRIHDRAAESARLWNRSDNRRLWGPPDLDSLRDWEKRKPEDLDSLLTDFLAASSRRQKRAKWMRGGLVAVVVAAVLGAALTYMVKERQLSAEQALRLIESKTKGEQIRQQLLSTYVKRGQQSLLEDHNLAKALPWLHRAQQAGSTEPILPDLLDDAMRSERMLKTVLVGHAGGVYSANYSPDGRRIVTASVDQTARVWDADSGLLITAFRAHEISVYSASFNPDGRRVVTAGADKTARVWELNSRLLLMELKGHTKDVLHASYSSDGSRIVTASADQTARVWDADSGRMLMELKGHTKNVLSASYSPDGRRIVTASEDQTARVWDAVSGRLLRELKGHANRVQSASYSPDGRRIITASSDSTARVWDADSGRMLSELKGHTQMVTSASYSPDGCRIVTASFDLTTRVWDAGSGRMITELKGHTKEVWSAQYSPDGRRIVTASLDKTARVWEPDSGRLVTELKGHTNEVKSARYSPDGRRIVTASLDHSARVWDPDNGSLLTVLQGHTNTVLSAKYSPDGRRIVTASSDKTARVWDANSGMVLTELKGNERSIFDASFHPDGRRIVTASWDGTIRVWDADNGQVVFEFERLSGSVSTATYSPDGHRIVTANADFSAKVWDADSGLLLLELKDTEGVHCASYSPDGHRIVTASAQKTARVWDADSGRLLSELNAAGIRSANFSPDGRRIVTASADNAARVWDADSGLLLAELKGHTSSVASASYSPDGRRILTAGDDGVAWVWDVSKNTPSEQAVGQFLRCFWGLRFERKDSDVLVEAVPNPSECHG